MILQPALLPSPPALTRLAFGLHVAAGTVGLLAGTVAVSAAKGARLHRVAGSVFFASMLVMAGFADYLAVAIPDQIPNFLVGTFVIYLVTTAWMAVRRPQGAIGAAEKVACAVILCLCLPLALLAFELATGLRPFLRSAVPLEGPVRIAIYSFATA